MCEERRRRQHDLDASVSVVFMTISSVTQTEDECLSPFVSRWWCLRRRRFWWQEGWSVFDIMKASHCFVCDKKTKRQRRFERQKNARTKRSFKWSYALMNGRVSYSFFCRFEFNEKTILRMTQKLRDGHSDHVDHMKCQPLMRSTSIRKHTYF